MNNNIVEYVKGILMIIFVSLIMFGLVLLPIGIVIPSQILFKLFLVSFISGCTGWSYLVLNNKMNK